MEANDLGKYIIADPGVCHGKPVFRGTRIMVRQVLEMVADGMDWGAICRECRGKVSEEAIAEALRIAAQALARHENRRPPELAALDEMYGEME